MSAVMHCYSPDAPQTERLAAYLEEKEARVERRKAFSRRHAGETVKAVSYAANLASRSVTLCATSSAEWLFSRMQSAAGRLQTKHVRPIP